MLRGVFISLISVWPLRTVCFRHWQCGIDQGIIYFSHGGVHPLNFLDTPQPRLPLEVLRVLTRTLIRSVALCYSQLGE